MRTGSDRPSRVEGGPEGRRARKKLEKRERIRDAAWELFGRDGFERTTTRDVAARAGVATGTLFLYASDKRDLLFLVMHDRLREAVDARFASLSRKAPLLDQLMHVFRAPFEVYARSPGVAAEFVRALPGADGPNARAVNGYTLAFLHQLAGVVSEAQARGEVDPRVPPLQAAANCFALYFAALLSWLGGIADLESALDPGLRNALDLQIRGFLPRPGAR